MVAMTKRQAEQLAIAAKKEGIGKADYLVASAVARWDCQEPDDAKRTWHLGETYAEQQARREASWQKAEAACRAHLIAIGGDPDA